MPEARRFRLRATYKKAGRLARMSHLEIARALEYAVRRSGLPFAISEGFSPHMKIAFGSALPVGVGSACEIFDLQLTQYVPAARALEALQASSVADLMVTDVTYIENGAAAASVAYPRSSYIARFEFANFAEGDGSEPSAPRGSVSEPEGASGVLSAVQASSQSDESLMRCVPSRLIHAQAEPAQNSMCSEPPSTPSASLTELAYEKLPGDSVADAGVEEGCAASDVTPVCVTESPVGDIQDALDRLVVPETIERVRKGKVKVLEVDNFLPEMPEVEGDSLYFDLVARKDGSLRPDVFLQGCLDATAAADPTFPKLRIAQVTRVAQR